MKTVIFEGREYDVPDQAAFMAREVDGDVFWYAVEPKYHGYGWVLDEAEAGVTFGYVEPNIKGHPKNSLQEV